MCESTAFLIEGNSRKKVAENISIAFTDRDEVVLRTVFGDEVRVKGRISKVDAERHEIVIEKLKKPMMRESRAEI